MRADVVAGRFALCDPLARGATGAVWRAWDLRREAYCAAKVMRQRDAADPLRFAREQGVRLTHPHLLTPYSWAAEDEHVVVASPLVAGGSVHTLLGDYGPLAEELVADLLDQLLAGLAHAHGAGLVHRDVTPANLLLDATGDGRPHLWLADFGLAVRSGEPRLTGLGTVLGTPGYLPPEVLAGALPAPSADLYAAGQVARALLHGAEPESPGTDVPEWVGVRLREVVGALVAVDPADRPASAEEARRMLAPVRPAESPRTAAGEPVTVLVQLPPLPPGWTPTGPATGPAPTADPPTAPVRAQPRTTRRNTPTLAVGTGAEPAAEPTAGSAAGSDASVAWQPAMPPIATPGSPGPPPRSLRSAGAEATEGPTAPATPEEPDGSIPRPTVVRADAATSPAAAPQPGTSAGAGAKQRNGSAAGRARRRWRGWLAAGAAAVLVAGGTAGVVALVDRDGSGGPASPPGTPTSAPPSAVPAAAGYPCGWQQEGDVATATDGRTVTCVRSGTTYRWQVS